MLYFANHFKLNYTMKHTSFRWFILALLFVATTLLYLDRSALGILAPELQKTIGWNEEQYGIINSVFMLAYACCFLLMGPVVDRIGTRRGYLLSVVVWSIAAVGHILARSWVGFAVARFCLAVGQSGNFPSAIKAVGEWFPKRERALAVSLFNGGSNMGTILSPLIIPTLVVSYGSWQIGFVWTLPLTLLWIVLWWKFYRRPQESKAVSIEELNHITSETEEEQPLGRIGWREILPHRPTWAIAVAKFMADPIWWVYLFWGTKFLNERYGVVLADVGLPFFTIYLASWAIGILLGWISSALMKSGSSLNKSRKLSLLCCGLFALPAMLVPHVDSMWAAVVLISLAAGGHCGWSANVFSLMNDLFPKQAAGSIAGLGGFAGGVGGAVVAYALGKTLQSIGVEGYSILFTVAGMGYLIALAIVHLIVPQIRRIELLPRT